MKNLLRNHKEYYVNKVLKVQAKTINKDRILINLLPLLKFNGKSQSSVVNNVDELLSYFWENEELFVGFSDNKELVEKWLKNDYMDMLHKESDKKESKFVSLLPLSLNAYKASNMTNRTDYGGSEELWHLLTKADEERKELGQNSIIQKLTDFLSNGYNREIDQVESADKQDLSTWLIASITNQLCNDQDNDKERVHSEDPLLCMTQARLLADDIDRLLAYQHVMSRTALIESLSQIMMLHIGLYVLRAAQLLPVMIEKKTMQIDCGCSKSNDVADLEACKYQPIFQIDMMQNYTSQLAKISERNIEMHEQQLSLFVESMFYIRKKLDFLEYLDAEKDYSLEEVLKFDLSNKKVESETYFKDRFEGLQEFVDELEKDPSEDYFTNYIEVVNREYNKFYVGFFKRLISSAFSKNDARGIFQQAGSHKKYTIGSQLLDTLIHLAMVEEHEGIYETKVLRLDQFLNWIQNRYGFYVDNIIPGFESSQAFHSLRQSKKYFTTKLQEIGYYQALSDAYNTQWLIARYDVKGGKGDATAGKATS